MLCGGESDDAPRGLYSLEIEPNSTNRDTMSYAITFQDRIDATHCCCVLEAFFEGLNDVSAEIIPFTIEVSFFISFLKNKWWWLLWGWYCLKLWGKGSAQHCSMSYRSSFLLFLLINAVFVYKSLSVMFCKSFGVTWYVIASVFVLLMIFSSYIIGLWDVFFLRK